MFLRVSVLLLLFSVPVTTAAQGYESGMPVPRILLVGDSWAGFPQALKSFDDALQDYPGLEDYVQLGYRTAIMGATTDDYLVTGLPLIEQELLRYPTLDIVTISLGGNDFLRGMEGYSRWRPTMTTEEEEVLFEAIE